MKSLFEEMGGTYTMQGDYRLPDITMPDQPDVELGHYAWQHRDYLRKRHRGLYYNLLTQGKLTEYLADVEQRALQMEDRLTEELMAQEGVTEQLKSTDMIAWVRKRNAITNMVQEIVNNEVIYT